MQRMKKLLSLEKSAPKNRTKDTAPVAPLKRGRKPTLDCPVRFNFFLPQTMLDEMAALRAKAEAVGIKRYTHSYILREGALLFVAQELAALKLAKKGELHAKKRK